MESSKRNGYNGFVSILRVPNARFTLDQLLVRDVERLGDLPHQPITHQTLRWKKYGEECELAEEIWLSKYPGYSILHETLMPRASAATLAKQAICRLASE